MQCSSYMGIDLAFNIAKSATPRWHHHNHDRHPLTQPASSSAYRPLGGFHVHVTVLPPMSVNVCAWQLAWLLLCGPQRVGSPLQLEPPGPPTCQLHVTVLPPMSVNVCAWQLAWLLCGPQRVGSPLHWPEPPVEAPEPLVEAPLEAPLEAPEEAEGPGLGLGLPEDAPGPVEADDGDDGDDGDDDEPAEVLQAETAASLEVMLKAMLTENQSEGIVADGLPSKTQLVGWTGRRP